jgi:hypothetical protein
MFLGALQFFQTAGLDFVMLPIRRRSTASDTVSPAGRQTSPRGVALLIADWMAAAENVCGRPGRPHLEADQSICRSTQTSKALPLASVSLYSDQFVVR